MLAGLRIGHFTHKTHATGLTVFLFDRPAVGAYWIAGSAPATHELVVLDPDNSVIEVNALVLSGGSAYGLFAAKGVMQYLTERGSGHPTRHGIVPIVPAAAIYDLAYQSAIPPSSQEAYQACLEATENNIKTGRVGVGTGATVGKLVPHAKHMTGGLGRAELTLKNGVKVIAYAAVNCTGDVRNLQGEIIAGACNEKHEFVDCEKYIVSGEAEEALFHNQNTTLVAVFTNAKFTKSDLKRIAKMAISGLARAISPVFTRYDGDLLFCISIGDLVASELTIGTMAADAVRLAIINAVHGAEVIQ